MNLNENSELLQYYIRELAYLRRAGSGFAQQYPKVASRLELGAEECADPHVERLIEAFALLTGRIQYNIDSEFSIFTAALLDNLYPHYLNPIPSMAIAQIDVDPEQGKLTSGHPIPKHTALFTEASNGEVCRFRTCYPVTLWPLQVSFAGFEPTSRYGFLDAVPEVSTVLRLHLSAIGEADINELDLRELRFHLHGMWVDVSNLYELLFCNLLRIGLLPKGEEHPYILPASALQPVGFAEEVLPAPGHAHPAYRLLQEYFAFPEKFLFADLRGLEHLPKKEGMREFDILFMFNHPPREGVHLSANNFRLGCTPIINLFRQISEPIRVHQRQVEYRLVPDMRREQTTEIHSILKVTGSSDERNESELLQPFFSFHHDMDGHEQRKFWYSRRQPSERPDLSGTEMFMSFLDLDFNPGTPAQDTVFAHTLCTNRHLGEQVSAQTEFQIEEVVPQQRIYCLNKPTPQLDPPLRGATVWRIISHLSLNYLSLTAGDESLKALREILRLYQFSAPQKAMERQINGIRGMSCQETMRRLGPDAWRGFVRGFEITLEFDPDMYVGGSAFLLASVLNHFFPLYVSSNSFTQLVIKNTQKEGVWKRWEPRSGRHILL